MTTDTDHDRIATTAYHLWEAEGCPHGRDTSHWVEAKEIVALRDSAGAALLPRTTGADEPVEERSIAIDNEGEAPNLTDTGEHDLTATAREPAITAPPKSAEPKSAEPKSAEPKPAEAKPATPKVKAAAKRASGADSSKSETAKPSKAKAPSKTGKTAKPR